MLNGELTLIKEISLNKKEELSDNANLILEKLLQTYPPDDLLIHFLSINSNKQGVKFETQFALFQICVPK